MRVQASAPREWLRADPTYHRLYVIWANCLLMFAAPTLLVSTLTVVIILAIRKVHLHLLCLLLE